MHVNGVRLGGTKTNGRGSAFREVGVRLGEDGLVSEKGRGKRGGGEGEQGGGGGAGEPQGAVP